MKLKLILFFLFGLLSAYITAQEICLEKRSHDYAIIKDLKEINGKHYITVDIIQIEYTGEASDYIIKNENKKLRTFNINPETQWEFCTSEVTTYKIRDLLKKRNLWEESQMNFSAFDGEITDSFHCSCAN
jgi:hypothetical protein